MTELLYILLPTLVALFGPVVAYGGVVDLYADQYAIDADFAKCIVKWESDWDLGVVGDNGDAVGLAQWHWESWICAREHAGWSTEDLRADPIEAIRTMCYAISQGWEHWWSTCERCREVNRVTENV